MAFSDWRSKAVSPAEAVRLLYSGMRVFLHGASATPTPLIEAMVARGDLERVRLYHIHTNGPAPWADPEQAGRFLSISLFTGAPLRKAVEEGRADFMPIFLSDIPGLFTSKKVPLDAAVLTVSPPDRHGNCSLGTSIDTAKAAADSARFIIADINDQMPRTHGNSVVPFSRISAFIHTNRPLYEHPPEPESEAESRIGEIIAGLIDDGATLQIGIGAIPEAALARLHNKRDLGVHSEMFSDRVVDLVESGAITNRHKSVHPGRVVTSFVYGTRRLYDFVDDNPLVEFHPCDRTNDTSIIRKNPKVHAINSALAIDLTGQVCADSIGHRIYSGIGGQMDFMRGAALSPGGKAILAVSATAMKGKVSRIVPELLPGSGVVTTRGHIHWVVTEFGAVNLHGMTLKERGRGVDLDRAPGLPRGAGARLRAHPPFHVRVNA